MSKLFLDLACVSMPHAANPATRLNPSQVTLRSFVNANRGREGEPQVRTLLICG